MCPCDASWTLGICVMKGWVRGTQEGRRALTTRVTGAPRGVFGWATPVCGHLRGKEGSAGTRLGVRAAPRPLFLLYFQFTTVLWFILT